jgi:hypothetical protein
MLVLLQEEGAMGDGTIGQHAARRRSIAARSISAGSSRQEHAACRTGKLSKLEQTALASWNLKLEAAIRFRVRNRKCECAHWAL